MFVAQPIARPHRRARVLPVADAHGAAAATAQPDPSERPLVHTDPGRGIRGRGSRWICGRRAAGGVASAPAEARCPPPCRLPRGGRRREVAEERAGRARCGRAAPGDTKPGNGDTSMTRNPESDKKAWNLHFFCSFRSRVEDALLLSCTTLPTMLPTMLPTCVGSTFAALTCGFAMLPMLPALPAVGRATR